MVAINQSFTAALLNGHWSTEPLQKETTMLGQNLGLFSFAPARPGTAEYKRQLEETNTILGEDLIGAVPAHRTKATVQLYNTGVITHYTQLLNLLSNALIVFEGADGPNQATESILVHHLKEFYKILLQREIKTWIENFARTSEGEHLPYALALDMHNSMVHLHKMATDPTWIRAVLQQDEVPANTILFYRSAHANVINNWRKSASGDNLGPYTSPPSTWTSPKATKEAAKKVPKVSETATPGAKSPRSFTAASISGQQPAARTNGSNPNYGMVSAPETIHHGPQLSSGKRLCLAFAVKGKSCPNGITWPGSHISFQNVSIPDLQLIDRWVTDTANMTFQPGSRRRGAGAAPPTGSAP
jgi:DNA-binding ferritin-like protein (Dps family)